MTRFEESRLVFEFGERWHIFKLDEHRDYQERIGKIDETKAVDFVGIWDNQELYFIEVKNFCGHRIENKNRFLKGQLTECQLIEGQCQLIKGELPLPIELAQKVRDSIACLIGAYRTSSIQEHWTAYAKWLCESHKSIKVVLWLEYDLPSHPILRRKAMVSVDIKKFKEKLKWLTSHVIVENRDQQRLLDLKVSNLPNT